MKRFLHIIATPRGEESRTLKVSASFLAELKNKYPEIVVDELNLFDEKLPEMTVKRVGGKMVLLGGKDLSGDLKEAWREIEIQIERFLNADGYLISTPMWNFSIPYRLKHYIDVILQPKYLFKYTDKGAVGLVTGRKMVVITSRGGDYGETSPFHSFDLQEPYLRNVFGFAGITDVKFVNAQPMDAMGPKIMEEKIASAILEAKMVAKNF